MTEVINVSPTAQPKSEALSYRVKADVNINLTRPRAYEYLELATFAGERPVRERHVQILLNEWKAGRFLWHNVILASAILNGVRYRLNGQHTCWMRVSIPENEDPDKAIVREIIYEVDSESQLRGLYSVIDRNAPRTSNHVTKTLLLDLASAYGIPSSYIGTLAAGFKLWHYAKDPDQASSPAEVTAAIQEVPELFRAVGLFFKEYCNDDTEFKRAAVIGAMFATFDKAILKAPEFWIPVINGLGMSDKNDPRYQLRKFIQTHGHGLGKGRTSVRVEDLFRICIVAWNKWRKEEPITVLRPTEKRQKVL